jgi:hypothetical protein
MPTSSWFDYLRRHRERKSVAPRAKAITPVSQTPSAPVNTDTQRADEPSVAKPASGIWSEIVVSHDKPVAHKSSQPVVARLVHNKNAVVSLIQKTAPVSLVCPWIERAALPLPY